MGSGPSQSDYEASEAERASASVAMAEYQYFKEKYDPLLQQARDESMSDDSVNKLRGRTNADTMQALTSQPTYRQTQSTTATGDTAQAIQGQLAEATKTGVGIQNQMKTNVLGTARGQAADAQTGMAEASRLKTSEALGRAKANRTVASAKFDAAGKVAGAALMQGLDNMGTTGTKENPDGTKTQVSGSFFSPVNSDGSKVSGFKNRLNYSQFFGG